jgi:hypothetical protein
MNFYRLPIEITAVYNVINVHYGYVNSCSRHPYCFVFHLVFVHGQKMYKNRQPVNKLRKSVASFIHMSTYVSCNKRKRNLSIVIEIESNRTYF